METVELFQTSQLLRFHVVILQFLQAITKQSKRKNSDHISDPVQLQMDSSPRNRQLSQITAMSRI